MNTKSARHRNSGATESPRVIRSHVPAWSNLHLRETGGFRARLFLVEALVLGFLALGVAAAAPVQERANPLKPLDRSSPRAALRTFLETGDEIGAFLAKEYISSPSREKYHEVLETSVGLLRSLDLSEIPPAARVKAGRAAAMALYAVLCRVDLPSWEEIPGNEIQGSGTNVAYWVVPNTEIVLVQSRGIQQGEFLFSAGTVARAGEFYERVKSMPYVRPVPLQNLAEIVAVGGGWMVPHKWIQSMPGWLKHALAKQALWKWISLVLLLAGFALFMRSAWRLSKRGVGQEPFRQALIELITPAFFLAATPVLSYLALVQLNMTGKVGSAIELAQTAVMYVAGAWIAWRIAPVIAEAIIASPKIAPESIDAHLIRICTRLLGILAGLGLLVTGADRVGMPLYGIIAGVGVGGLAIALAAQPTIENLIGGLSLFADKPIRVGDDCRYGEDMGKVEAIGIRSTRIRGLDRTVTTIPNAALSRMPVVNLSQRDHILLKTVVAVRYETTPAQLRLLLSRIREMLLSDRRVSPNQLRVRFVGFGSSALEIEISALVMTCDWAEFGGIREELYLRIMDIVQEVGTSFAFPSQTLYFARDSGPTQGRAPGAKAEAQAGENPGSSRLDRSSGDETASGK